MPIHRPAACRAIDAVSKRRGDGARLIREMTTGRVFFGPTMAIASNRIGNSITDLSAGRTLAADYLEWKTVCTIV